MKWLFSPGIPSPPPSTSIDVTNEEVLKSSIKTENKRKAKRLASFLPIALLVLGFLGLAAYNADFKIPKQLVTSVAKIKSYLRLKDAGTPYQSTKLSQDFTPSQYDLDLKFLLKEQTWLTRDQEYDFEDTFHGKVSIQMVCKQRTSTIELNALNLIIKMETLEVKNGKTILRNATFVEDPKTEKWIFTFDPFDFLANNEIVMSFEYEGHISSDDMHGIYKTTYKGHDEKRRSTLATQFEPQSARKVVPCFDEPDKKATWKIKVTYPYNFTALSNAPVKEITEGPDGMEVVQFEPSPIMSSYLVAIVVGKLSGKHTLSETGVDVGVYGNAQSSVTQLDYALEVAVGALEFMENFTHAEFPLKKMDLVGLTDFETGAMENWGLLTFKQILLFFNPQFYPPSSQAQIAKTVNHEVAHQWFGDMITMKDWQYTWLNEGFASLFENLILESQQLGAFGDNMVQHMDTAMEFDCLWTVSHPLTYKLDFPYEINNNFDAISYNKGAVVLWMVRQLMTPKAFEEAIQDYFRRKKLENVVPEDLFDSFNRHVPSEVEGPDGNKLDVGLFMRQYTEQTGFPVITVSKPSANIVRFDQARYQPTTEIAEDPKYVNSEFGHKWDVPIWYHNGTDVYLKWLKRDAPYVDVESSMNVMVNVKGMMYYKFKMLKADLDLIVNNVTVLEEYPENYVIRWFESIYNPVYIGHYSPDSLMNLAKNLVKKKMVALANLAKTGWKTLLKSSRDPEVHELYKKVEHVLEYDNVVNPGQKKFFSAKSYSSAVVNRFKEATKSNSPKNFENAVKEMKDCGDDCIQDLTRGLKGKYSCNRNSLRTSECSTIAAESRALLYCNMVKNETKAYKVLLHYYKHEIVEKEKLHLLQGLLCTENQGQLKFWLDRIIDSNNMANVNVRVQDIPSVYQQVAGNSVGRTIILDYFIENWKKIHESLQHNQYVLNEVVRAVASVIYNDTMKGKFDAFKSLNPETAKMRVFSEVSELIIQHNKWNTPYKQAFINFFQK